jgi:hypothetical protein
VKEKSKLVDQEQTKTPVKTENPDNIDWAKITEMQKQVDIGDAEKMKNAKRFNSKDITDKSTLLRKVYDEVSDSVVYYKIFSYQNLVDMIKDVDAAQTNQEKSAYILFKQLQNGGDKTVSYEAVKSWPGDLVARLLTKLQVDGNFFPQSASTPSKSKTGSP